MVTVVLLYCSNICPNYYLDIGVVKGGGGCTGDTRPILQGVAQQSEGVPEAENKMPALLQPPVMNSSAVGSSLKPKEKSVNPGVQRQFRGVLHVARILNDLPQLVHSPNYGLGNPLFGTTE